MLDNNVLKCTVCDDIYTHFLCTIEVRTKPDTYETTSILIDGRNPVDIQIDYPFRSQSNIHLVFACENGEYFVISFDGHKGNVFTEGNDVMEGLQEWLNDDLNNWIEKDPENHSIELTKDSRLISSIEDYFYYIGRDSL